MNNIMNCPTNINDDNDARNRRRTTTTTTTTPPPCHCVVNDENDDTSTKLNSNSCANWRRQLPNKNRRSVVIWNQMLSIFSFRRNYCNKNISSSSSLTIQKGGLLQNHHHHHRYPTRMKKNSIVKLSVTTLLVLIMLLFLHWIGNSIQNDIMSSLYTRVDGDGDGVYYTYNHHSSTKNIKNSFSTNKDKEIDRHYSSSSSITFPPRYVYYELLHNDDGYGNGNGNIDYKQQNESNNNNRRGISYESAMMMQQQKQQQQVAASQTILRRMKLSQNRRTRTTTRRKQQQPQQQQNLQHDDDERNNIQKTLAATRTIKTTSSIIVPTNRSSLSTHSSNNNNNKNKNNDDNDDCILLYPWQNQVYPTCNMLHEVDMRNRLNLRSTSSSSSNVTNSDVNRLDDKIQYIAYGYWRDVWKIIHSTPTSVVKNITATTITTTTAQVTKKRDEVVILKTLRFQHEFTIRNYDRHRRDAMIMEHLTSNQAIVNIFGYCSNSVFSEYGDGGDLVDAIWPNKQRRKKTKKKRQNSPKNDEENDDGNSGQHLVVEEQSNQQKTVSMMKNYSVQVALGMPETAITTNNRNLSTATSHNPLEDLEDDEPKDLPLVDVPSNKLTKKEKLLIAMQAAMGVAAIHNVDKEGQASIAHTDISPGQFIRIDGKNPGSNRSPEEYQYLEQTEKVDVYSLGNILYMLLQEEWPFQDIADDTEAQELVIKGVRPSFDESVWKSTDFIDQALKEAMIMCHQQNATIRASARQVESFLIGKLEKLFRGSFERV